MSTRRMATYGVGFVVLVAGAAIMGLLTMLKRPAVEATEIPDEPVLNVRGTRVSSSDVPVTIQGYGEARPIREVRLAPEVGGVVVEVHPTFVVGGRIAANDVLFRLDARPYEAQLREAEAIAGQLAAAEKRLAVERDAEAQRLPTLNRNQDIAEAAYTRAQEMEAQGIGNRTEMESAEAAYNNAADALDQLEQQLALYDVRIEEAGENLRAAQARVDMARLDLEKTTVRSPFDGRITERHLDLGHAARAGEVAVGLADDSVLEIPVPINSVDAQRWLEFHAHDSTNGAWFDGIAKVAATVRWTDGAADLTWRGVVDRVAAFDSNARTLSIVVRVSADDASEGSFPLTAGMFCDVSIPGRTLRNVFAVPREAVTVDGEVYLAVDGRLASRTVTVAREQDGIAYVEDGLASGDTVITTRLVNPIENTRVAVELAAGGE